ncbi:DegT/DnrJ/EryC1/StrS family aminotransferase, partial [bacterium]|nr:DegT/DnrJ/EryC1/StrS family aminotransferase [bacterium]
MKTNQLNYQIPLSRPDISELEINSIFDVLKTPNLSLGPKLNEFEERFAEYVGARYAIAVCNGTAGLHLAVKSMNIGANDAVITTPFSFISSSNCLLFENATPIFVDIDESSFNIDPDKIEKYVRQDCAWDKKERILIDRNTG